MATPLQAYTYIPDANGKPLAAGKVYAFEPGGTYTIPRATYTDEGGLTPNSHPVILNDAGLAAIYLDGVYDIKVTDSTGVTVWVKPDVSSIGDNEWLSKVSAIQVTASQVKVIGDLTSVFTVKRAVKIKDSSTVYGFVNSVSYVGGYTFISINTTATLSASVSYISAGVVSAISMPTFDIGAVVFGGVTTNSRGAAGYIVTGLTDGTSASLDGIDGLTGGPVIGGFPAELADNDFAFRVDPTTEIVSYHVMNSASGASELSPYVISPNTNPGTKRWLLKFFKYLKAAVNIGGFTNAGDFTNADGDVICAAYAKGLVLADGSKVVTETGTGLHIVPKSDALPPTVRDAANVAEVLVLKPPSNANALTGTSVNEPITPANLDYVLNSRVGTANAADIKTAINASGNAPIYACRAWVNFTGVGTISIRASGNISSLTDHGTGDYTINFSTEMPDVNYAVLPGAESESAYPAEGRSTSVRYNTRQTGSVRLNAGKTGASPMDIFGVFVGIFR